MNIAKNLFSKTKFLSTILILLSTWFLYIGIHWIIFDRLIGSWEDIKRGECHFKILTHPHMECRNVQYEKADLSVQAENLIIRSSLKPLGLKLQSQSLAINHRNKAQKNTIHIQKASSLVTFSPQQVIFNDLSANHLTLKIEKGGISVEELRGTLDFTKETHLLKCDDGHLKGLKFLQAPLDDVGFKFTSGIDHTKVDIRFKNPEEIINLLENLGFIKGWAKNAFLLGAGLLKNAQQEITLPLILTKDGFEIDLPLLNLFSKKNIP